MGNSVIIRKNQFKQSADTVTFDILLQGEEKQGFLVWFDGIFNLYQLDSYSIFYRCITFNRDDSR